MLLRVHVSEDWTVADIETLGRGYHYGTAIIQPSEDNVPNIIVYRGGESATNQTNQQLLAYGGTDTTIVDGITLDESWGDVHQVACVADGLYLANTRHNAVTYYNWESGHREDLVIGGVHTDRHHVNSVFPTSAGIFVLLHNRGRRESEVLLARHEVAVGFEVVWAKSLWDQMAHNIYVDDRYLVYNASLARSLVVVQHATRSRVHRRRFEGHTKGLAVTSSHYVVGHSDIAPRHDRGNSSSSLLAVNRNTLEIEAQVALQVEGLPVGNINEVRYLSGPDKGHSAMDIPVPDFGRVSLAGQNPVNLAIRRAGYRVRRGAHTLKRAFEENGRRTQPGLAAHALPEDGESTVRR
jgi:hypothetical protein